MSPTIRESLQELLRNWQDEAYVTPLCQLNQFQALNHASANDRQRSVREAIVKLLDALATHHPIQAQVLQLRFWASQPVMKTAQQLYIAEPTVHKMQASAIDWIAGQLEEQEQAAPTG